MQVILTKDVPKVGQKGQLITVKSGFFRNFLSPKGFAVNATKTLKEKAIEVNARIEAEAKEAAEKAAELRDKLEAEAIKLVSKLTKKGTLYSKISEKNIAEAVKDQMKETIDHASVSIKEAIKTVGNHSASVKLAPGVTAILKIVVEGEEEK